MSKDRYRALARTRQEQKAAIVAELPTPSIDGRVATMRLYDPIDSWGGYWGVSAKEFAEALDQLGSQVDEIQLHINSPGGEVFEGIAILNLLRQHKARVIVTVDALAASAASFIAMAADELIMAPNSELMIHDAWGLCVGNAGDMREMAGRLDKISDNIAAAYAARAGGTVEDWRAAMHAETWYSAEEAVTAGLADRVLETPSDKTSASLDPTEAKARFDLSIFTYAGREAAPPPAVPVTPDPSTAPAGEKATAGGAAVLSTHAVLAADVLGQGIEH